MRLKITNNEKIKNLLSDTPFYLLYLVNAIEKKVIKINISHFEEEIISVKNKEDIINIYTVYKDSKNNFYTIYRNNKEYIRNKGVSVSWKIEKAISYNFLLNKNVIKTSNQIEKLEDEIKNNINKLVKIKLKYEKAIKEKNILMDKLLNQETE